MQELGRQPTIAEIARRVERPVSSVALCMRKTQKPHAMDAAPTDSEKDSMVDLIVSAEDEQPTSLHDLMHRYSASMLMYSMQDTKASCSGCCAH